MGKNWKSKVCIINAVDCNVNLGNVSFSELSSWGGAADNGTEQPRWAFKDDFSYIRGSHSLKFGVTYDHQEANGFGQQNIAGQASFSFLETAVPGATSATSGSSLRVVPARLRRYRRDGDGPLPEAGLPLLGLLRAGRLAHQPQADSQLRPALRIHAAAGVGRRPVLRLLADHAESGGEQLSRRADLRRQRAGTAGRAQPDPRILRRRSRRASGWPTARIRRPPSAPASGRSFGRVTVLASSSHYAGFIGQYAFASTNQGITPAFNWDQGLPSYPLPPQINPAFANNGNVDWWNGQNSTRPAEYDNWTVSVQREIRPHLTVEVGLQRA